MVCLARPGIPQTQKNMAFVFLLEIAASVLIIGLSIPMILGMVKPNYWYGFRVPKTLSDPSIWYPANRFAGKILLIAGIVSLAGAVALFTLNRRLDLESHLDVDNLAWLSLAVFVFPLVAVVVATFVYLRKL